MQFHLKRRQQFLSETKYEADLAMWSEALVGQRENLLKPEGSDRGWHASMRQGIGDTLFIQLVLRYTAGEPIEPLRSQLEDVVAAFEHYGDLLWKNMQDRNEPVFEFNVIDSYCQLLQIVGLCFLLHRRDLLPRIAAMQDGEGGTSNGGADVIFEEFMIHAVGPEKRFSTEQACQVRPYENLFFALTEDTTARQLKELDLFLKHWYKELAGTPWHDSHKPDEQGNQGGYYGYWSFEAGAAVLLLGIEDDSSLHKYLYYPKDMVVWAREHAALSVADEKSAARLRALAGEPCPRAGWWLTPAKSDSRRRFTVGEAMPSAGSDYGATIWQWDESQSS